MEEKEAEKVDTYLFCTVVVLLLDWFAGRWPKQTAGYEEKFIKPIWGASLR